MLDRDLTLSAVAEELRLPLYETWELAEGRPRECTEAEQQELVLALRERDVSYSKIEQLLGVPHTTAWGWANRDRAARRRSAQRREREERERTLRKRQIRELRAAKIGYVEIGERLGVSAMTAWRWASDENDAKYRARAAEQRQRRRKGVARAA